MKKLNIQSFADAQITTGLDEVRGGYKVITTFLHTSHSSSTKVVVIQNNSFADHRPPPRHAISHVKTLNIW